MSEPLAIFPLGTVLFPGLVLPLHIFEDRYRALVRDLMALPEGAPRRFGVLLIREGRGVGVDGVRALHEVGCAAELRRVTPYDDGRYDIVTTGGARFRLRELDRSGAYLVGAVDFLAEDAGDAGTARVLTGGVQAVFGTYLDALAAAQGGEITMPELPDDPTLLSYLVAATVVVDLADRQRLLAEPDAARRLRAELSLLKRETAMLRLLSAAPAPELARQPMNPN